MTTISASSTIGIVLSSPSYTNPVVINPGVTISNSVYPELAVSASTGAWTIENNGSIAGAQGAGIYLGGSGGLITNAASASISGFEAVAIANGIGTVVNYGSIAGYSSPGGEGVVSGTGGSVTNQSGATISGYYGVLLADGGAVTNAASASITGVYVGVAISGGAGTVVNYGHIAGTGSGGDGVILRSGGSITNAAAASITGEAFGVDGVGFVEVDAARDAADEVIRVRVFAAEDGVDFYDFFLPFKGFEVVGDGDEVLLGA